MITRCENCRKELDMDFPSRYIYYTPDGDMFCNYSCYNAWSNKVLTDWM